MPIPLFDRIAATGHEQVIYCQDPGANYRAIIAIHSTRLGPAIGGTRVLPYLNEDAALTDALRLSRAMTFKNAIAGLSVGGGKAVIIAPGGGFDRELLFRAHGRFVERLGGRFSTGEDVGTTAADMEFVARETRWVGGRTGHGAGDPSPWTALGVFRGIEAAAKECWGTSDLRDRRVALQGLGNVGMGLGQHLFKAGAHLIVADVDPERVRRAVETWNAEVADPSCIHAADADIFAPCALGGGVNDQTIPELRAKIVAGAANNQLLEDRHGETLATLGILYIPDYVLNAGGVMTAGVGLHGWTLDALESRVRGIFDTVASVVRAARLKRIPTNVAADQLAEARIEAGH